MASPDYDWGPDDFGPEDWEALLPDIDRISEEQEREAKERWEEEEDTKYPKIGSYDPHDWDVSDRLREEQWKEEEAAGWQWREEAAELKREQCERNINMAERQLTLEERFVFLEGKIDGLVAALASTLTSIASDKEDRKRIVQALQAAERLVELDPKDSRYTIHQLGLKNVTYRLGEILLKS